MTQNKFFTIEVTTFVDNQIITAYNLGYIFGSYAQARSYLLDDYIYGKELRILCCDTTAEFFVHDNEHRENHYEIVEVKPYSSDIF